MTASSRTPTTQQARVLRTLRAFDEHGNTWPSTSAVHAVVEKSKPGTNRRRVFELLNAVHRNGWVNLELSGPPVDSLGTHITWGLVDAGREALRRAHGASESTKETIVESTTQEPPAAQAPWDTEDAASNEPLEEQITPHEALAALVELDEEAEGEPLEGEVDDPEDDNPPVNEGANQLTLAVGGPKPKSSILKVLARQQKFGTTRQFKNGERIPFSGVLEVREVSIKQEANGHILRTQKAVIAEFILDGDELNEDDD